MLKNWVFLNLALSFMKIVEFLEIPWVFSSLSFWADAEKISLYKPSPSNIPPSPPKPPVAHPTTTTPQLNFYTPQKSNVGMPVKFQIWEGPEGSLTKFSFFPKAKVNLVKKCQSIGGGPEGPSLHKIPNSNAGLPRKTQQKNDNWHQEKISFQIHWLFRTSQRPLLPTRGHFQPFVNYGCKKAPRERQSPFHFFTTVPTNKYLFLNLAPVFRTRMK